MTERRSIRLDDNDLVAGAQILSWIARPHRPESAVKILNHWYWELQRDRGKQIPDLPFALSKRNRIELQFRRLEADCLTGMRAGVWLQWKVLENSQHPWFTDAGTSTRELARRRAETKGTNTDPANEIRDIWQKRKPVLHLALSAGDALGRWLTERDLYGFGLSGAVLDPSWVPDAIERSEKWCRSASQFFPAENFYHFHRDTF
jgi:hypothetical protein